MTPWNRNRIRRHWPVRSYLLGIMVVASLAVVAGCAYGFVWSSQRAEDAARADLQDRANHANRMIETSITWGSKTVAALTTQPLAVFFRNPSATCSLTVDGTEAFPRARLDLVTPDGRTVCSSSAAAKVPGAPVHAGAPWLAAAVEDPHLRVRWSEIDAVTGQRAVVITTGVSAGGRVIGVVVAFLGVPEVGPALAANLAGSNGASFSVVDRTSGVVVSSSTRPGGGTTPAARSETADGTDQLFASRAVAGGAWLVYAGVPRAQVLAQARGALFRQAGVGLLALLLLGAGIWLVNRRIAGPLRAVTQAAVKATRDPHGDRVAEVGTEELVTLARQFNTMLDVRAGFEAELSHRATHDSLTGLPNRAVLLENLDHALRHAPGTGSIPAVLCLGLNRFALINDSLGPAGADQVLVDVAGILGNHLGPRDLLARHNGAEFFVLSHVGDEAPGDAVAEAVGIAARLCASLDRRLSGPAADLVLSASVGVAVASGRPSPEQMLREANCAMHQARTDGVAYSVFDKATEVRATAHLEIERDLRQALQNRELVVYYQPLLEISTHTIVGAEALVRWQHPRRGLVSPLDFIPVAEETGQIVPLGAYVLDEACRQSAAWAASGHPLRISVNVAVGQLQHDLPGTVRATLETSGLNPPDLCLELTESTLVRTARQRGNDFERLRDLGVHLAIDDFGTGYSSLSYLHDLPATELKIDRSFITRLDHHPHDGHLVEAIIGMSHGLGLGVVAEGVETGTQLGYLEALQCGLAQGYLIAPPQPADRFLTLLDLDRADAPSVRLAQALSRPTPDPSGR